MRAAAAVAVALVAVALLAFPIAFILILGGLLGGSPGGSLLGDSGPSQTAIEDIPADLLPVYQAAAKTCPGLSWTVLAGIGKVETDHARSGLPGVHSGQNFAGAKGPMQFLQSTWDAFKVAAPGHTVPNIYDPADAIFTAAHYLCSNGAGIPARLRQAIWHYNHLWSYVDLVMSWAGRYARAAQWVGSGAVTVVADILRSSPAGILIESGPPFSPVFGGVPPGGVNRTGAPGNCTWWASYNVLVPSHFMGDGGAWVWWYKSHGYRVTEYIPEVDGSATGAPTTGTRTVPPAGSVVSWLRPYDSHFHAGHVAVVIASNPTTGTFEISEMNYRGLWSVTQRTVSVRDPMLIGFVAPDQLAIASQHPTD